MKYYLVFRSNNKYLGYTTSKKDIKRLLKQRKKSEYNIKVFSEKDLNPDLIKKIKSGLGELYAYSSDGVEDGPMIFDFEELDIMDQMPEFCIILDERLYSLVQLLKYIKLDDEDKVIYKGLETIEIIMRDIRDMEPMEFGEILDFEKIIKEYTKNNDSEQP